MATSGFSLIMSNLGSQLAADFDYGSALEFRSRYFIQMFSQRRP